MGEARREQVEATMAAVNARDFEALDALPFHPEMEFLSVIARAEGRVYRGVEGLREWARDIDEIWRGFRIVVAGVREVDSRRAVVTMTLTGTARGSGVPLDVTVAQVWEWREGQLWRTVAFSSEREALAYVGLAPGGRTEERA